MKTTKKARRELLASEFIGKACETVKAIAYYSHEAYKCPDVQRDVNELYKAWNTAQLALELMTNKSYALRHDGIMDIKATYVKIVNLYDAEDTLYEYKF